MAITPLPTPPSRADSTNFAQRADAFMAALPTLVTETNAATADITEKQGIASAAANTAAEQAGIATTKAGQAGAGAAAASDSEEAAALSEAAALAHKNAAAASADSAGGSAIAAANSAASVEPRPKRNYLINGNMRVDQNGTAAAAISLTTSNQFAVDRWAVSCSPAPSGVLYGFQTAGDTSLDKELRFYKQSGSWAGTTPGVQVIESDAARQLAGQTVTLKFKARRGADFAGTVSAVIATGTGIDEGVEKATGGIWAGHASQLVIDAQPVGTSLTEYTVAVVIPAGTNEIAIQLVATHTANAGSVNNWVAFTKAQIGVGSDFIEKTLAEDYEDCFRYNYVIAGENLPAGTGLCLSAGSALVQLKLPHPMRVAPTATASSLFMIDAGGSSKTVGSATINKYSAAGIISLFITESSGLVSGAGAFMAVGTAGTPGKLTFRSEL